MGRTLRTWSVIVTTTLLLLGCGGDDADSPSSDTTAATTTEAEAARSTGEPAPTTAEAEPEEDGSGDLCSALQEVADLTAEIDTAAEADDWASVQAAYANLGPALVDAYEAAAAAADDETVVDDLTLLGDLIDQTVDLVASSTSFEEFAPAVSALPGAEEGESASDRLDGYSSAECGFALKS